MYCKYAKEQSSLQLSGNCSRGNSKKRFITLDVNFTLSKNLGENKIPPYFCTLFVLIDKKISGEFIIKADPTSVKLHYQTISSPRKIMLF
jgi:hypothetical protein